LLADEHLGQYARDGLEQMPDARAGEALRAALGSLQGRALIGAVNSLGVRREAAAVEALGRLVANPSAGAAGPALIALGRIGGAAALRIVEPMLASAAPELRAAAAEACLLHANHLLDAGEGGPALVLFQKVRAADVPTPLRLAATRGAILADERGRLALLLESLHSPDADLRDVALLSLRDLPGAVVTTALLAELDRLAPPVQALVIEVLAERGGPEVLHAIERRAGTENAEVRQAALRALGKIGGASSVPILIGALSAEPPVAAASLARIATPEADAFILQALLTAKRPDDLRLIAVLGSRRAASALPELIAFAQGADAEKANESLRALALIANPSDLPRLIALSSAVRDEDARVLADRAIVTTAMKIIEPARRADAVLAAFRATSEPAAKAALLRPLASVVRSMGGSHEAFFVVRSAPKDRDEGLRAAAVRCLSDWPDAAPTTALLDIANDKGVSPVRREAALSGALRLISPVATGRERSPLNVAQSFAGAVRAAQTHDEKLLVIAGLGEWKRPEAVAVLESYLRDPDVRAEAAAALAQQKSAAKTKGKAKAAAPAPKTTPASGALFNGTDLAGWDGDPGVWRVRAGVIVGGSLEGNPRNEFLATTRRYRNFTLRLEYRLTGTEGFVNGGVQFRSVRIPQPPNEMSGYQADIGAGHSGCLYDESRRKKFLARATDEQIKRLEKSGEWNHYEIICDGPRTELRLNGETTVTYEESDPGVALDGLIALQIHGNCKAEIAYRNLVLEERP
ncbi:MAG: DUF1080 domain-containing protein, partial [Opitutaceae bacterium]